MKIVVAILILLNCSYLYSPSKNSSQESAQFLPDTLNNQPSVLVSKMNFINKYADSLNNINATDPLPDFLFDCEFDIKHPAHWNSIHNPISLRKQIIDQVMNINVLNTLARSTDIKLTTTCPHEYKIENDYPFVYHLIF